MKIVIFLYFTAFIGCAIAASGPFGFEGRIVELRFKILPVFTGLYFELGHWLKMLCDILVELLDLLFACLW